MSPTSAHIEAVRSVDVVLTAACNLKCAYCYQNSRSGARMEWETLRAAADLLLRSRRRRLTMIFYGGEPLLEFDRIRRAVEYLGEHLAPGRTIEYKVSTNGTVLDDEKIAFLAAHGVETQLSFDGVAAAQRLRGVSTFAQLDSLLDRLRFEYPSFYRDHCTVSTTLTAATIPYLAESVEYFTDKQVPQLDIAYRMTFEPDWSGELRDALALQFERVYRSSLRYYHRTGRVPVALFRRARRERPDPSGRRPMCNVADTDTVTVDADGQVYGCVLFAESYQTFPTSLLRERLQPMRLGSVKDPQLGQRLANYPSAVRAAGLFDNKQNKYSSYERCRDCRYLTTCMVCPVSIGHLPGNSDPDRVPDLACAFNLLCHEYRNRFPYLPDGRELLSGKARVPDLVRQLWERAAGG